MGFDAGCTTLGAEEKIREEPSPRMMRRAMMTPATIKTTTPAIAASRRR